MKVQKKSLDLAAIRIPDRQAYSIVSTPITLSWFFNKPWGFNFLLLFSITTNSTAQQRSEISHLSGKPQEQMWKTPVCIYSV